VDGSGERLVFRAADASDDSKIRALLEATALPFDDVSSERQELIVAVADGQVVGCGGLETFGGEALIRSLAVAQGHRGVGLGGQLYDRLVARAREKGLTRLFLLTTTAALYFTRRGFRLVQRSAVPAAMAESAQFASLCPATASCMALSL
jgi:amino-acid N-acetyltransferase